MAKRIEELKILPEKWEKTMEEKDKDHKVVPIAELIKRSMEKLNDSSKR